MSPMTNWRCDEERADLIAAARAMREEGVVMHEVARQLGVPVSTLHRWAAEGGWRTMDMAAARMRAAFGERAEASPAPGETGADTAPQAEGGPEPHPEPGPEPQAGPAPEPRPEPGPGDEPDAPYQFICPIQARIAGERAMKAAFALMVDGELKSASQTMQLAERMLGAARVLGELPLPPENDEAARRESEKNHAELTRRIRNLVKMALRGEVSCLPKWATSKSFLADTLYPDQYNWDDTAEQE
ncbi:hypothetical protein F1654_08830 [Alkalicaulis satelles]|uniref:Uncharacterized protein n=1 Tax=Alkalicaulis satelles TaxID=2609175 RepID=A0A5M6ZNU1_9PROT|nr:hypothetical protein [Alkalicaulis satelles]KAA5803891.1 hypothetical protein F1654_08830 [Alkalicaulis satelles]